MPPQNATAARPAARTQPMAVVPFIAAAHEHTEIGVDVSLTPGANSQLIGPFDIPAYGFLRHFTILSTASGGTLGAGVFHPDAPFNAYSELVIYDVNGAPLYGPMTGYMTFLANLYGGYAFDSDPRNDPDYGATIGWNFMLRLPVEISHHDGLGSLGNENAAASYKFRATLNVLTAATGIFTTAPTTPAVVRTRAYLEAWSQPAATDPLGRAQETVPPRHGTTQFWSYTQRQLSTGAQTIPISRVGNLIRTMIFVVRDNTANANRQAIANMPDPVKLRWDARELTNESVFLRRKLQEEGLVTSGVLPAGVLVYSFDRQALGHVGDGSPALWLPTVQSSRLEFVSDNFPAAGNLDILMNDIAIAETNPAQRYVETSSTGFHPAPAAAPMQGG